MPSEKRDHGGGRYRAPGPSYVEHGSGITLVMHGGSIAGYTTVAVRTLAPELAIVVHLDRDRPNLAGALGRDILLGLAVRDRE